MDGVMLEFPLCCLSIPEDDIDKIEMIISYCIVEHSLKVNSYIHKRIRELQRRLPTDFEDFDESHSKIVLAADELGISISSIEKNQSNHQRVSSYIATFTEKNGKDAFCRIGKEICFETKTKKFDYSLFTILCAIQSIIGKKKLYCRITKDRVRYRMHGYKSKEVAEESMIDKSILLSDRQIGIRINTLNGKNLISKFTYAKRQTFYSTRLTDEELRERVKESKLYWAGKKASVIDKQITEEIKINLKLIKLNGRVCA
jgi:hypothetical protein